MEHLLENTSKRYKLIWTISVEKQEHKAGPLWGASMNKNSVSQVLRRQI
jgi:hypothetical protein